jgi:hypothetical protein
MEYLVEAVGVELSTVFRVCNLNEYGVLKVPLCRGYRTSIVRTGLAEHNFCRVPGT